MVNETKNMIYIGDCNLPHRIGDTECSECFGGDPREPDAYPKLCKCGGLIHVEFGDHYEDSFFDYWLFTKCDKCGEPQW